MQRPSSGLRLSASPFLLHLAGTDLRGSRAQVAALGAILVLGIAVRALLVPTGWFRGDIEPFTRWANVLQAVPMGEFYSRGAPESNYLPGYLYVLAATGLVRMYLVGLAPTPIEFVAWVKASPILADMVLAAAVFCLCRRYVSIPRSLAAAALVAFNPAVIFVSAVWGQSDSVGSALSMLSLVALISGSPVAAAVLAGAAFVVKPQYTLFLVVAGVAYLRKETLSVRSLGTGATGSVWAKWTALRLVLPVVALIAAVQLLILPFSVSLWPAANARWSLHERLSLAEGWASITSANAFNLWGTPIAGLWLPDSSRGWLSLSYQGWGWLLFAAVTAAALVLAWCRPNNLPAVLWGCLIVAYGFFELPTRIHERYLFMAIPLLAAAAVLKRWVLPFYVAISGLYLVNLWYVYSLQPSVGKGGLMDLPNLVSMASTFGVLVLIACLAALVVLMIPTTGRSDAPAAQWAGEGVLSLRRVRQGVLSLRRRGVDLHGVPSRGLELARVPVRVNAGLAVVALLAAFVGGIYVGRLAGAEGPPPAAASAVVATVRADRSWQDTGLKVVSGQKVSISSVRGEWTHQRGMIGSYGPKGAGKNDNMAILPTAPVGVVVGRIGNSSPFSVGEGVTVTASTSGSLQLVMNDWPEGHGDNEGSMSARVSLSEP